MIPIDASIVWTKAPVEGHTEVTAVDKQTGFCDHFMSYYKQIMWDQGLIRVRIK